MAGGDAQGAVAVGAHVDGRGRGRGRRQRRGADGGDGGARRQLVDEADRDAPVDVAARDVAAAKLAPRAARGGGRQPRLALRPVQGVLQGALQRGGRGERRLHVRRLCVGARGHGVRLQDRRDRHGHRRQVRRREARAHRDRRQERGRAPLARDLDQRARGGREAQRQARRRRELRVPSHLERARQRPGARVVSRGDARACAGRGGAGAPSFSDARARARRRAPLSSSPVRR